MRIVITVYLYIYMEILASLGRYKNNKHTHAIYQNKLCAPKKKLGIWMKVRRVHIYVKRAVCRKK